MQPLRLTAVVARNLKTMPLVDRIAPTLQGVLDDSALHCAPLNELYRQLNTGGVEIDLAKCMASLPRAFQWMDDWTGGKVSLPLRSTWNGKLVGRPHAGADWYVTARN